MSSLTSASVALRLPPSRRCPDALNRPSPPAPAKAGTNARDDSVGDVRKEHACAAVRPDLHLSRHVVLFARRSRTQFPRQRQRSPRRRWGSGADSRARPSSSRGRATLAECLSRLTLTGAALPRPERFSRGRPTARRGPAVRPHVCPSGSSRPFLLRESIDEHVSSVAGLAGRRYLLHSGRPRVASPRRAAQSIPPAARLSRPTRTCDLQRPPDRTGDDFRTRAPAADSCNRPARPGRAAGCRNERHPVGPLRHRVRRRQHMVSPDR